MYCASGLFEAGFYPQNVRFQNVWFQNVQFLNLTTYETKSLGIAKFAFLFKVKSVSFYLLLGIMVIYGKTTL
jgi:hypothetical protein